MPAPLDHHRLAALVAYEIGRLLHALDVGHVPLGVFQVLLETVVELGHGGAPVDLALFDIVQLLFHAGCVAHVEKVREALEQQVGHDHA